MAWFLVVLDARSHPNITTESFLLPESVIQSVKDESSPEQAVCRYLCSRGPVTPQACRCWFWLPCLGKVCKKGTSCRIRGKKSVPQTVCCPPFSNKMGKQCQERRSFITYRRSTPYFMYNRSTGACEIHHWTANQVQMVTIPGYTTSGACSLCSLYKMCEGPIIDRLSAASEITSYSIQ
ncbi:uncharacterized protein LOC124275528 [Haliotis rubra]|uniref:uncharacterized protein LOC124275528 n=1 Tax=Haliotis rubra TaxID=36100 RepID=UPI001EE5B10F|nr:uncharacterized protein LOC124275528 [Haliotis rubra]